MIRSANPALRHDTFQMPHALGMPETTMTLQGTVNKCFILLGMLLLTAAFAWNAHATEQMGLVSVCMWGGVIGSFIVAIVLTFKHSWAPVLAPTYALLEGLALGGISAFFEAMHPGLVMQAVGLTFAVFAALLFAYKSGVIRATENFKLGLVAALGGVAIFVLVTMVMRMFGLNTEFYHGTSMLSIGISLVIVVVAALCLVMDFDFIESGAEAGAPKYMEWYGAFGLVVTLAWLYLEMLRLLAKIQGRD